MRRKLNLLQRVKNKISDIMGIGVNSYLKNVSGVIHVGANKGQEREVYKKYDLKVIWIEPIPDVFDTLKMNLSKYKDQEAFNSLITDVDYKEYNFNIANNEGASSSIFNFDKHKEIWPEVDFVKKITLTSITLDTLIDEKGIDISNYDALVLDTQGSELLVLKGGNSSLRHFKYIITEVADFESYEYCCKLSDVNEFMKDHGYIQVFKRKFAESRDYGSYFDVIYSRKH